MQDCNLLRPYFLLISADDALKSQNSTFIQDKQYLESVLGQSQDSWFESLTAQQIQCQKSSRVKPRCSIVDSPTCSPTVSQLIHGQLSVGPSPTGLRHSSPAPYCGHEVSFNGRLSLGTPQSDDWDRSLLHLSPGPSPIVQNKSVLSHPSSSGVYSLGLDDSNLSWTNSLATPPSDPNQKDLLVSGANFSPPRTKDTARALFSPGCELDTTGDSVLPLDSTFEDDQSDLDGSKSDLLQSNLIQSNKNGNQTIKEPCGKQDTNNSSTISLSQEVKAKADNQSPVQIKHNEKLKDNLNKRLISRKDTLTESSKKSKSKNRNSITSFNGCDVDKSVKTESDSKPVTDFVKNNDNQEYSLSPTFSQKSKRSKVKGHKSPNVSYRCERSSIDDVLSDFFDPPAASVGRRKPAPSRKRKSLELEDSVISDIHNATESSFNTCRSDTALDVSTPSGTLQSILTSDKKTKVSSSKKVRFSDSVEKCTFIPELDTYSGRRADKKSLRKKSTAKKPKSIDDGQSKHNTTNDSLVNKKNIKGNGHEYKIESELEVKKFNRHQNAKSKKEVLSEKYFYPESSDNDILFDCTKFPIQNTKAQSSVPLRRNRSNIEIDKPENHKLNIGTRHENEIDNKILVPSLNKALDDNSEEDLFSQVSPSALNEMCNVAEKPVTCEENSNGTASYHKGNSGNSGSGEKQSKPAKVKRFLYPSVSHIAGASSSKVFRYKEHETKDLNKKVLLSSVKLVDVVDKDLDKSVDTQKHRNEVEENLPENVFDVVEKENFLQNRMMQEIMTKHKSDKTNLSPSTTKIVEKLPDGQSKSAFDFQSAAGRLAVSVPKEALEKAATLLTEDIKENKALKLTPLESLCSPVKDFKHVYSVQGNKHTEETAKVEKFEIECTPQGKIYACNYDSGNHSLMGFQCASGKTLNIPKEALEKAANVFKENIPDCKSSLDFTAQSLHTDITTSDTEYSAKAIARGLQSGLKICTNLPSQTLEDDALLKQVNKSETDIANNPKNIEPLSITGKSSYMSTGFQLASGKELLVPEGQLEKAASLLQEENITGTSYSNIQVKTREEKVVDKQNEYGIEDAFIEDIEFSEWCEEDMEPDEIFDLETEIKVEDIKNDLSGNETSDGLKPSNYESTEHKLNDRTTGVLANIGSEREGSSKKFIETLKKDDDSKMVALSGMSEENSKLGEMCFRKSEEKCNHVDKLLKKGQLRSSTDEKSESSFCAHADIVLKNESELNLNSYTQNENQHLIHDQSKLGLSFPSSKFKGFQTANGKSLALSEEKLKHAEELLNDTDCKKTTHLNNEANFDKKKTMKLTAQTVLQTNKTHENSMEEKGTNSKLVGVQKGPAVAGLPVAIDKLDYTLGRESNVQVLKQHDVISDTFRGNKPKYGFNNIGKVSDRMSVAERLALEFGNSSTMDGSCKNNSNNFEDELKDLEDLKRNRKSRMEKENIILGPEKQVRSAGENVPKGFRPFKPPKITKFSSHEKYPQSVVKDWECTKQTHSDSVVSSKDNPYQNSLGHCHEVVSTDKLKTAKSKIVIYPKSELKHKVQGSDYKFCTNTNSMGLNDVSTIGNKILNETVTSNTIKPESFENSNVKVDSNTTNVSTVDLQGISQMFEDDMEFTQLESADINGSFDIENDANNEKEEEKARVFDAKEEKSKSDLKTNFVGFSTALGRSVSISKTALESAVKVLSKCDEYKSTPEGRQLHMNYDTDKKVVSKNVTGEEIMASRSSVSQHSLDNKNKVNNDNGVDKCNGEKTDQTLYIKLSERALKEARKSVSSFMQGNTCMNGTLSCPIVNQPKSIDENRSAVSLKIDRETKFESQRFAVNLVCEDASLHKKDQTQSLCLFQTASGKSVNISNDALKVAKQTLDGYNEETKTSVSDQSGDLVVQEGSSLNIVNNNKLLDNKKLESVPANYVSEKAFPKVAEVSHFSEFCGFSTASGIKVEVLETALTHAKNTLANAEDMDEKYKSSSFTIVAGTEVSLSEKAIEVDKTALESSAIENTTHILSTDSGHKIQGSEKAIEYAKASLVSNRDSDKNEYYSNSHINTASGLIEEVTDKIRDVIGKSIDNEMSESVGSFSSSVGFSTASGRRVEVSEKALKHSINQLSETVSSNRDTEPETEFAGLSTASGKRVEVSEKALKHVLKNLSDTDSLNGKQESETKFAGFSTASGNRVKVSEKALVHAQKQLSKIDGSEGNLETQTKFEGLSTASGNRIKVFEKALKHAKNQVLESDSSNRNLESETKCTELSTASCNKNALKHKNQLSETDCSNKYSESETKFAGFSTASGNRVKVSEKALKHAKDQLSENDGSIRNLESETKFAGFSTASGKKVEVSEVALKHAKNQLSETDGSNSNPEYGTKFAGFSMTFGKRVEVSEKALKQGKTNMLEIDDSSRILESESKFAGFSTASGNRVEVSEKALKHAKNQMSETDGSYSNQESRTKFAGFSTASGNRVKVSEKALKHAKNQLSENDDSNRYLESETKFAGFSTASGKKVEVSEKALKHAKNQLSETDGSNRNPEIEHKFVGFSTASGSSVQVSEKALKHVKNHLLETDRLNRNSESEIMFSKASGKTVQVLESALPLATNSLIEDHKGDNLIKQLGGIYTSEFSGMISNHVDENEKDHLGDSENEIGATNFEEMFGMALKRRKLDMNRERKLMQNLTDEGSSCKRKAIKSQSKGVADQRHPGFRPFKPVFCKSLNKQQERQDVNAISKQNSISTKPACSVTSSFQAPYKSTPEKSTVSSDSVGSTQPDAMVKAPVYIPNNSNQGQGDSCEKKSDMKSDMKHMMPSGDYRQNSFHDVKGGSEMQHMSVKSNSPGDYSGDIQLADNSTKQERSNLLDEIQKFENVVSKEAVSSNTEEVAKSDVTETAQVSDQCEFDSFSQDEDDVYYCTLVEARRHQDCCIKQKGAGRVRPVPGRLLKMKQAQNRSKLKDLINNLGQKSYRFDVHVTSENAMNHKFLMESYYERNTAHVAVGDGAYLVPDDAGKIGKHEFYRAFLTIEGIDANLTSEAWVYNHYRWVVWKLAAYEKTSTCLRKRSLTPDMVMLQLKYRYDREVDLSQRSAIKKIYERDDTPSKRLVLCVAAIKGGNTAGSSVDQSKPVLPEKMMLELTDGWYSIPAQIDLPLTHLVQRRKISVGQKLCMTGAELVGGEDACTPLEAPSSVMLKIYRNSTRPAPWDSKLGYQSDPRPLCVPLSDLNCDGGIVGVMDVVIVRKYSTLFMEKFEGGGCIFRTSRCEDRARQEYEVKKQSEMEKLYRQMEDKTEKEQKQERKVKQCKKYSRTDIEGFQSGQDIYESMEESAQPDIVQNYLSEHQLGMLYEYQRQMQEQKQFELNSKFQRAWQDKLEVFSERVVTPVLKLRVAGCSNRDLDQNASTVLTVWRPAAEISDIQEGHRYKLYSLSASASRSKYTAHMVQLTATKQTRFRRMQLDENILDRIYEPREVLWVSDIKRRQPPYGEFDFVGIIVKIAQSSSSDRMCDMVYLADCQTGLLGVRFWNGYKSFGEDLFMVGSVLCCSNLMDKSPYRSPQIPTVEASPEFTHITNKSQNTAQRKALDKLLAVSKDKAAFIEKANTVMDQLQNENIDKNIPQRILGITDDFIKEFPRRNVGRQSVNPCQAESKNHIGSAGAENGHITSVHQYPRHKQEDKSFPVDQAMNFNSYETKTAERKSEISICGEDKMHIMDVNPSTPDQTVISTPMMERKRATAQAKMSQLMTYGSPSVLSPLSSTVPRSVSKGFKPPAFKKL